MTTVVSLFPSGWWGRRTMLLGAALVVTGAALLHVGDANAGTCWQDDYVGALYQTLIDVDPSNMRQIAIVDSFMTAQLKWSTKEAVKLDNSDESAECWF